MFEDIVSNKYLIIALIIALLVVLYLYSQKKPCSVEKMQNVNLTNPINSTNSTKPTKQSHELLEKQWVDKKADLSTKNKLHDNAQFAPFAPRADQSWENYFNNNAEIKMGKYKSLPQPLDDRPDLSQCQPCICPKPKKWQRYLDSDDEDSDDEYEYIIRRKKSNKN